MTLGCSALSEFHMVNGKPMPNEALVQFANQQYLNLESFKRDGTSVRTPVRFAEDDGVLYIYTLANAWKVKRIRRNPRVRIAPCTIRGNVTGQWGEAEAYIVDDTTTEHGHAFLLRKYGWKKWLGNIFSGLMKRERIVITILLAE
jgi:PPOX class probable F420-dependent enzyme